MGRNHKLKKNGFLQSYRLSYMIKEAFDNLPSGICYFDHRGVPLLINKTMYDVMYRLNGRDIQDISDFDGVFSSAVPVSDGTIWHFQKKEAGEDGSFIEIVASDITRLHQKKLELEADTAQQQQLLSRLEEFGRNIVSVTRNEEILSMKMRLHSELGIALAETRQFIHSDFAPEKKAAYVENHRRIARKLLGEIGQDDEIDIFHELQINAEKIGAKIVLEGDLPKYAEGLMTQVVRECLINAIRHADGNRVTVITGAKERTFTAVITNNGQAPASPVIEGGGLKSLREKIEAAGGTMSLQSQPEYCMKLTLPIPFGVVSNQV